MTEHGSSDTIIDVTYHAGRDHYFLRAHAEPTDEIAYTPISPLGGFLIFDNHSQGRMIAGGYQATDEEAATVLSELFGSEFQFYTDSMRDGAQIYGSDERKLQMTVPYTNQRRLAFIAFHAMAVNANQPIKDLAAKIAAYSNQSSAT
jgi:hypothetical protein